MSPALHGARRPLAQFHASPVSARSAAQRLVLRPSASAVDAQVTQPAQVGRREREGRRERKQEKGEEEEAGGRERFVKRKKDSLRMAGKRGRRREDGDGQREERWRKRGETGRERREEEVDSWFLS
eukprot:768609-Hanusia_phi.AAC.1